MFDLPDLTIPLQPDEIWVCFNPDGTRYRTSTATYPETFALDQAMGKRVVRVRLVPVEPTDQSRKAEVDAEIFKLLNHEDRRAQRIGMELAKLVYSSVGRTGDPEGGLRLRPQHHRRDEGTDSVRLEPPHRVVGNYQCNYQPETLMLHSTEVTKQADALSHELDVLDDRLEDSRFPPPTVRTVLAVASVTARAVEMLLRVQAERLEQDEATLQVLRGLR